MLIIVASSRAAGLAATPQIKAVPAAMWARPVARMICNFHGRNAGTSATMLGAKRRWETPNTMSAGPIDIRAVTRQRSRADFEIDRSAKSVQSASAPHPTDKAPLR